MPRLLLQGLLKLGLTYLLTTPLLISLILVETTLPRLQLLWPPLAQCAVLVLSGAGLVAWLRRRWRPLLASLASLAYAGLFLGYPRLAPFALALCLLLGLLGFLWRNPLSDRLLGQIPLQAGAWVFLTLAYEPYCVAWAPLVTGYAPLATAWANALNDLLVQTAQLANVALWLVVYWLGRRAYRRLPALWRKIRRPAPVAKPVLSGDGPPSSD